MKTNRFVLAFYCLFASPLASAGLYFGQADDYNLDTPLGKLTGHLSRNCTDYSQSECTVTIHLKGKPIYVGNRLIPVVTAVYTGENPSRANGVSRWVAKENTITEASKGKRLQSWWVFDFSRSTPHVLKFQLPPNDDIANVHWTSQGATIRSHKGFGFRYRNGAITKLR